MVCGIIGLWTGSVYSAMSRSCWTFRSGSERNGQCAPTPARNSLLLQQLVRADRDQPAVADLHLAVQLPQPLVLPAILRTETSRAPARRPSGRAPGSRTASGPGRCGQPARSREIGFRRECPRAWCCSFEPGACRMNARRAEVARNSWNPGDFAGRQSSFRPPHSAGAMRSVVSSSSGSASTSRASRAATCSRRSRRSRRSCLNLANLGGAQLDPHAVQLRGQRVAELARLIIGEIQPRHAVEKVTLAVAELPRGGFSARRLTLAGPRGLHTTPCFSRPRSACSSSCRPPACSATGWGRRARAPPGRDRKSHAAWASRAARAGWAAHRFHVLDGADAFLRPQADRARGGQQHRDHLPPHALAGGQRGGPTARAASPLRRCAPGVRRCGIR